MERDWPLDPETIALMADLRELEHLVSRLERLNERAPGYGLEQEQYVDPSTGIEDTLLGWLRLLAQSLGEGAYRDQMSGTDWRWEEFKRLQHQRWKELYPPLTEEG